MITWIRAYSAQGSNHLGDPHEVTREPWYAKGDASRFSRHSN